jgi:hypothetical protein
MTTTINGENFERVTRSETVGSCRQGRIEADYSELVSVFGQPDRGDGYKTDAEWRMRFPDGTLATIYNYCDGVASRGRRGKPVEQIGRWHVGGSSELAVEWIENTLEDAAFAKMDVLDAAADAARVAALSTTRRVLGHNFVPMTQSDWEGLSGAEEGSLICYPDPDEDLVLILSPSGQVTEIRGDDAGMSETVWTAVPRYVGA